MRTTGDPAKLCEERLRSIGYTTTHLENRQGSFAAVVYDVFVRGTSGREERFVYKQPPEDRLGEFALLRDLGAELSPWLPAVVARFEATPRAFLMRYAGEPLLPPEAVRAAGRTERLSAYERISAALADLHLRTLPYARQWAREGRASPYAFSREWADRMLRDADGALPSVLAAELSRIVTSFYADYGPSSMRGPETFTHGDPHIGNALALDGKLTLIDWEWTNVAAPMRDVAILAMDEPEDALYARIAEAHADKLVRGGMPATVEALLDDFGRMTVDNALMTLGWDAALFRRGDTTAREFAEAAERRLSRLAPFWNRLRR
ncbi:phosphotransferase [Paenibacillus sp.]|uniref:phosphotransferase n=1 Tax=Paenibacillus sp. TaxID=58172 RepID=UPI002D70F687|nr:phosphotransferase [Paenibacillus sp.]HZG56556.1 phosphotransferase [Paenibacillus sp.]